MVTQYATTCTEPSVPHQVTHVNGVLRLFAPQCTSLPSPRAFEPTAVTVRGPEGGGRWIRIAGAPERFEDARMAPWELEWVASPWWGLPWAEKWVRSWAQRWIPPVSSHLLRRRPGAAVGAATGDGVAVGRHRG